MELLAKVDNYIESQLDGLTGIARVVVGLSGGADSVGLLHLLASLLPKKSIVLQAVHINHHIRGEAADEDQKYVQQICDEWDIPLVCYQVDVPDLAKKLGCGEEEAGRIARYDCYSKCVQDAPGTVVALAHHLDDQVETVLFRMCRGTGLTGLAGMQAKMVRKDGVTVIRPLLDCTKQEIITYLEDHHISYCEDMTNADDEYTRNYIRHTVIPNLQTINEQSVAHISHLVQHVQQQNTFVEKILCQMDKEQIQKEYDCYGEQTGYLWIDTNWLKEQDAYVIDWMLRKMISRQATGLKDISQKHIQLLKNMVLSQNHQDCVQLPGELEGFICYGKLLIGKNNTEQGNCENLVKISLQNEPNTLNYGLSSKKNYTQMVDCAKIRNMLSVRFRQENDVIGVGNGHQKALNKFFIDEKVPRHLRDRILLVCDGNTVVWIVGYRLNPDYYVTDDTVEGMQLEFLGCSKEEREKTYGTGED